MVQQYSEDEIERWVTIRGKRFPVLKDGSLGVGKEELEEEDPRKYRKMFSGSDGQLTAKIVKNIPLGNWDGKYAVYFYALGSLDYDVPGSHHMGMKVYDTEQKAIAAAKRYVKKWED